VVLIRQTCSRPAQSDRAKGLRRGRDAVRHTPWVAGPVSRKRRLHRAFTVIWPIF